MAKKSRDQKRKQKKAQRQLRQAERVSLAYRGNKYKTDELVPLTLDIETAIYECYVMSGRRMTDHDVRRALTRLIREMRHQSLPAPGGGPDGSQPNHEVAAGGLEDLIAWNVRTRLGSYFETHPHPGRETLIGVLRTILGSTEVWGSIAPESRGYLRFIEDFLNRLGVSVKCYTEETLPDELREQLLPRPGSSSSTQTSVRSRRYGKV